MQKSKKSFLSNNYFKNLTQPEIAHHFKINPLIILPTGSTEQHQVLADCYRAQKNFAEVEILWDELRKASPSAALVTEGR